MTKFESERLQWGNQGRSVVHVLAVGGCGSNTFVGDGCLQRVSKQDSGVFQKLTPRRIMWVRFET